MLYIFQKGQMGEKYPQWSVSLWSALYFWKMYPKLSSHAQTPNMNS